MEEAGLLGPGRHGRRRRGGRPAPERGGVDGQDLGRVRVGAEHALQDLERGGQVGVEARVVHCSGSSLACLGQ